MSTLPWGNAMKFGFGVLRLAPRDFWAMTPRELSAAFEMHNGADRSGVPISEADFSKLMKKFPDSEGQN